MRRHFFQTSVGYHTCSKGSTVINSLFSQPLLSTTLHVANWVRKTWTGRYNGLACLFTELINAVRAPLMSAGESSVTVSLYLVILLPQLWLMEPFQAACRKQHKAKRQKLGNSSPCGHTREGKETGRIFSPPPLNPDLGIRCRGVLVFPLISASHQALLL